MNKAFMAIALLFAFSTVFAMSASAGENSSGLGYVYADGWIYYRITDENGKPSINKIRDDGTDAQKLLDVGGYPMSMSGDTLYFTNDEGVCRVKTDGQGYEVLSPANQDSWGMGGLVAAGDYVYLREGRYLYRYSVNPWALIGEVRLPDRLDQKFMIVDDWIYLADMDNTPDEGVKFYKIRTDFTQNSAWFQAPATGGVSYWSIIDGKLYYGISREGMAQLRRVNLTGTGDELVFESKVIVRWFDGEWVYGRRFADEPEYTSAEDSWDDVAYYYYGVEESFGRANILTGALERLGDTMPEEMAGDWFIDTSKLRGWGEGPPSMYKKDRSAEVSMAPRGYTAPVEESPAVYLPAAMSIKEGTLTPAGATLIIENLLDSRIGTGDAYYLERLVNGSYEIMPFINGVEDKASNAAAYVIDENGVREEQVNWTDYYGTLETGRYRIAKTIHASGTPHQVCADFVIGNPALPGENMLPSGTGYAYDDVWDAYVYYWLKKEDYRTSLNRIGPNGSDAQELLSDGRGYTMTIAGDRIYMLDQDGMISAVKKDGTGYVQLGSATKNSGGWTSQQICATGEYLYVLEDNAFARFSLDPWKKLSETAIPVGMDSRFQISDGWVYFMDFDSDKAEVRNFYKMRTDEPGISTWFQTPMRGRMSHWSVRAGKLFYAFFDQWTGAAELRCVSLDGTGDRQVLTGLITEFLDDEWAYGGRLSEAPQIVEGDEAQGIYGYRYYPEEEGFWRANLTTGEFQRLGDQSRDRMVMAGGILIDTWSSLGVPVMYNQDRTDVISMAIPGD